MLFAFAVTALNAIRLKKIKMWEIWRASVVGGRRAASAALTHLGLTCDLVSRAATRFLPEGVDRLAVLTLVGGGSTLT